MFGRQVNFEEDKITLCGKDWKQELLKCEFEEED